MEFQLTFMVDVVVEAADLEEAERLAHRMEAECKLGGALALVDHQGTVARRDNRKPTGDILWGEFNFDTIGHLEEQIEARKEYARRTGIDRLETTGRDLVADIGKRWAESYPDCCEFCGAETAGDCHCTDGQENDGGDLAEEEAPVSEAGGEG